MYEETKTLFAVIGAVILFAIASVVVQANMESATYNRLTGAKTTWWDAVWVELRVNGTAKQDD